MPILKPVFLGRLGAKITKVNKRLLRNGGRGRGEGVTDAVRGMKLVDFGPDKLLVVSENDLHVLSLQNQVALSSISPRKG